MGDAFPLQDIRVERFGPRHVRVTVPSTLRVRRYRRAAFYGRLVGLLVFLGFFVFSLAANGKDIAWDLCGGSLTLFILLSLIYAICYPDRVMRFSDREITIECQDRSITVVSAEGRSRSYRADEVIRVQARRCDFSRCGGIQIIWRRQRRVSRALAALYANVEGTTDAVAALNEAINCPAA